MPGLAKGLGTCQKIRRAQFTFRLTSLKTRDGFNVLIAGKRMTIIFLRRKSADWFRNHTPDDMTRPAPARAQFCAHYR